MMKKIFCAMLVLGSAVSAGAQIQTNAGVQYLQAMQKDMSTDFYDLSNTYFLADSLSSFDAATGEGLVNWKRYRLSPRQAFNLNGYWPVRMQMLDFPDAAYVNDPDLKIKIESLDVENWLDRWDCPFREEDLPDGKIRLNDYFSLIHGFYERDEYDNVVDYSKTSLWQLCYEPELMCQNTGVHKATGTVKLIELSDKCRFYFWQNGKGINGTQELTKEEFMGFFDGVNPHEGLKMMDVSIVVRKNQALEVRLEDRL